MAPVRSVISTILRQILAAHLVVTVLLLSGFGAFVLHQSDVLNRTALAAERHRADGAIRARLVQLANMASDYAVWNDAYEHLMLRFDGEWADRQFGVDIWNDLPFRMQGAFFIDPAGVTRYGVWRGQTAGGGIDTYLGDQAQPLIAAARRSHQPVQRLLSVRGVPFLAGASSVRPTSEEQYGRIHHGGVFIWIEAIDDDFIAPVARDFLFDDLRWQPAVGKGQGDLALTAADGSAAGYLTWKGDRPGDILLHRAALPAAALVAVCLLASLWQARLTRRAAQMLRIEQEKALVAAALTDTLKQEANTDALTLLLNRRGLAHASAMIFAAATESNTTVGALMIDLDRFKPINDQFGHALGDDILREVARRLTGCVRQQDLVARLGGDEFVILLSEADREGLELLASRIVDTLGFPYRCAGGPVTVGASLGAALLGDGEDLEDLIARADLALFGAKQAGRAGWRFAA